MKCLAGLATSGGVRLRRTSDLCPPAQNTDQRLRVASPHLGVGAWLATSGGVRLCRTSNLCPSAWLVTIGLKR